MNKLRTLLGETLIVAIITVFSYFLYLEKERGYLKAFGLFETNGLIPVTPQNVIPSVFYTLLTTLMILVFSFLLVYVLSSIPVSKHKKNNWLRNATWYIALSACPLLICSPLLVLTYIQNKRVFVLQLLGAMVEYFVFLFVLPFMVRHRKGNQNLSQKDAMKKISGSLVKKFGSKENYLVFVVTFFVVLMLPIFSFSYGYLDARLKNGFLAANIEESTYLLVRQYGERLIFVQLKDDDLLPVYRIESINNVTELKLIKKGNISFDEIRKFEERKFLGYF